jgi:glycosyltransferase involved in cell wall biosynthesis
MELADHEDVLIADEPEDFARALIQLYESEELWNRLSKNGIEKTKAMYSVSAARKRLRQLFSDSHFKRFRTSKLKMLTSKLGPGSNRRRHGIS